MKKKKIWVAALLIPVSLFVCSPVTVGREVTASIDSIKAKSVDQIEKANQLHQEAARLLEQKEIDKAIEKEKEAVAAAPHYWLPHAALGYLYFGRGGPAIQEAGESVTTAHPALAELNLALLMQYFHMYDQSIEAFKKLLTADPGSYLAKAGLATSLIGMNKTADGRMVLAEAYASRSKDPVVLDAIARAYFDSGDMSKTKELCQEALALTSDKRLSERLRKLLLVAAVNTGDATLLDSLSKSSLDLQPYERVWLKGMQLKFAKSNQEAQEIFHSFETVETTNEQWLSLSAILQERAVHDEAEKTSWLQMANSCLDRAEKIEPNNVEIRIRLAAVEEKLGNSKGALRKLEAGWNDTPCEPSPKVIHANDEVAKKEVTELAKSISKKADKGDYQTNLSTVEVALPNVTCGCRYKLIRYAALNLPGVINVMIGPGPHPAALLIFDNQTSSKNSIFESKSITALHENLEIGAEHPVATILELDKVMSKFEAPLPAPSFFAESVTLQFPTIDPAFR